MSDDSSDFQHSMSQFMGSVSQNLRHDLAKAREMTGGHKHPTMDLASQTIIIPVFERDEDGHCKMKLTGQDAPAQARIIVNLLKAAGAYDASKAGQGTDRYLRCTVPDGQMAELQGNFKNISDTIANEGDQITRMMAASLYLDQKRAGGLTKLQLAKYELPKREQAVLEGDVTGRQAALVQKRTGYIPQGKGGFTMAAQTSEPKLIEKLTAAGFPARTGNFSTSDMTQDFDGTEFMAKPERVEEMLAAIQSFAHEQGATQLTLEKQHAAAIEAQRMIASPSGVSGSQKNTLHR